MSDEENPSEPTAFERHADDSAPSLAAEFWDFLIREKRWWLTPIFLVLGILGALVLLSNSAAAPFIYTFF